jgi:DNA polymerase III subunit delta'
MLIMLIMLIMLVITVISSLSTMFDYVLRHASAALPDWLQTQLSAVLSAPDALQTLSPTTAINDPHCTGGASYAVAMAHALLCETPMSARLSHGGLACGQCGQCALLKAGNHPDLMVLVPENIDTHYLANSSGGAGGKADKDKKPSKTIKIEQLRAIENNLILSSQRGGRKVVIIYPAELLGNVTANALLKTLEEPPPNTFFIVVSEQWGQVLPTLRSRCVCQTLEQPNVAAKIAWLELNKIAHPKRWLELSAGKVDTAMAMAQDPLWLPLLKLMPYLLQGAHTDAMGLAQDMAKAELKRVVQVLGLWLHDVLAVSQHAPARFFAAQNEAIAQLVLTLKSEAAAQYAMRLSAIAPIVEHPLNARTQCEFLLLEYKKIFSIQTG